MTDIEYAGPGKGNGGPVVVGLGEVLWDLLPDGPQLGGAPANFAYHAAALGAQAVVASAVGDDERGRELLARLQAAGLDVRRVAVDPEHPTGTVTVALATDGKPFYTIHERVAWDFIPASDELMALARRANSVCYGSLAQRSPVSRETIGKFLAATPSDCLRVFDVNLRQDYFSPDILRESIEHANVLKLSDEELPVLLRLLGLEGQEGRSEWAAAETLGNRFGLRVVALTRGPRGCLLRLDKQTVDHPGIAPDRIADTVGAGDAFTAALVMGLLAGRSPWAIAQHANRLAAYVCSQSGAMPAVPKVLLPPSSD